MMIANLECNIFINLLLRETFGEGILRRLRDRTASTHDTSVTVICSTRNSPPISPRETFHMVKIQ